MRIFMMLLVAGGVMFSSTTCTAGDACAALDAGQVQAGGEIGRRLQVTIDNNLLAIDLDNDFLKPFQIRSSTGGYVGLGKTIDAFARFAAYSRDKRVIERKDYLVRETIKAQQPDGYLGIMEPDSRIKCAWDVHEMSYLVLGLTSDYKFCGSEASLAAARKLADYLIGKLSATPRPQVGPDDLSAIMPTTGMDEAFLYLSDVSGDPQYRDFVVKVRQLPAWRMPLVLGRWGKIEGHAYAYMCKCLEQIRLDRSMPDAGLWDMTNGMFRFLLDGDGLVISGTCGDHECWHNTQSGTTNLGETCASAYLVRFYDELLRRTGNPLCGDLMERDMHNALFAAQSPDGRKIRYYTPFEAPRVYHDVDSYCCPCNYRRILPEIPGMIFYQRDGGVFVNLYTSAKAQFAMENGMKLTLGQETDYPNSGEVKIRLGMEKAASFPVSLRVPLWAKDMTIKVNGQSLAPDSPSPGIARLQREWNPGDVIEISMPMELRMVKGRKTQDGRVAIMRGPMLFTYSPKANPGLAKFEPRLLVLDPASVAGPFPDNSVREGGMACKAKVWLPGAWYPSATTSEIVLTEFTDPDAISTYFLIPNPNAPGPVDDELAGTGSALLASVNH